MEILRCLFSSTPSSQQKRPTSPKEPSQHVWLESSSSKKLHLNPEYLRQMEPFLQKYLVNQTLAIKSLTLILLRYHSKLYQLQNSHSVTTQPIIRSNPIPPSTNPLFLTFIGSSGLGKIYASKLVAHYCHRQFVYIDLALLKNQIHLLDSQLFDILKWHASLQHQSNGLVICLHHLESCNEEMLDYLLQVFETKTWKWKRRIVAPQKPAPRKKEATNESVQQPLEEEEEILLHCKQVIFVGIIEMRDQVIMDLLEETMSWKQVSSLQMNLTSAKVPPPQMIKKQQQQQVHHHQPSPPMQQQAIQPIIEEPLQQYSEKNGMKPTSFALQDSLPHLDILDTITEFREKMTSKLLQENLFSISFLLRMNQMIPFFPFTNQTLLHEMVTTLNHLLQQYYHSTQIQVTYGEEIIIWLMKRWKPSMNSSNLIENHIITNLASIESELKAQDTVYLTIEPQSNKLVMRIHSLSNKHVSIVSRL